jgi:hypothetical protein
MSEIITVGLDLAKNVFQAHGADASGRAVLRKEAETGSGPWIFRTAAVLRRCDGSLWRRPFLGP